MTTEPSKMLTAEALLGGYGDETSALVDLPSGRGTVRVRGLSRNEALQVRNGDNLAAKDNIMISLGMVEPQMTIAQVDDWASLPASAGDTAYVSQRISELSGMGEGAGKSGVPNVRRKR